MRKKKKENMLFFNIMKVVLFLIVLIIVFKIAPNYEINDTYAKDKIILTKN